ncbi:MAG: endonuclease domain-containing protein [Dermatophilaceae bacterium]
MPRRLRALPTELDGAAFSVGAATGAGVTRQRLRHRSLDAPTRGLRVQQPSTTLVEHAGALALVLPSPWAYSHETAAGLLGLPLPTAWTPDRPLSVVRPSHCAAVKRPGVRGHRGLERRDVLILRGLPVTDVVDTWCDLATRLGLVELVVAGDAALNRADVDLDGFRTAVALRRGRRGARNRAAALPLLRIGSGSPMETRARLAFRNAGLPEPALNADIVDDSGSWVARADFVWREARLIVEYEGDEHRTDRRRWQADIARIQLLEDLGWKVLRITARDLSTPRRVAAMTDHIRKALLARAG